MFFICISINTYYFVMQFIARNQNHMTYTHIVSVRLSNNRYMFFIIYVIILWFDMIYSYSLNSTTFFFNSIGSNGEIIGILEFWVRLSEGEPKDVQKERMVRKIIQNQTDQLPINRDLYWSRIQSEVNNKVHYLYDIR